MGSRQSGAALLRFASIGDLTDEGEDGQALLTRVQQAAALMLKQHPTAAMRHVHRWLGQKAEYLKA